ncbi:hypothetical protein BGZ65_009548, partial [Modicella reniformis]
PAPLQVKNISVDSQTPSATSSSVVSPSPLSNSVTNNNSNGGVYGNSKDVSPSGSSTNLVSLITSGKVQHIQEKLSKTSLSSVHGFKPQEHLQKGTIRANPFYQLDRNSSGRSSLADLSSTNGQNSPEISNIITATSQRLRSSSRVSPTIAAAIAKSDSRVSSGATTPSPTTAIAAATAAATAAVATSTSTRSISSDSETDEDREAAKKNADGMVSPATSPELGTLKDRLPSATTRTLTAAAVAAKQQQLLQKHQQQQLATPPNSGHDVQIQEEEILEVEEDVPFVVPVARTTSNKNSSRHSIFVDETAQAMDALSRARHRQSMIQNGGPHPDEDDEEEDDEVYSVTQGIEPPEKWHYSEEDEDDDDDEDYDDDDEHENDNQNVQYRPNGERRRKRHDSFMSAKSVLPDISTVSVVEQARHDTRSDVDEKSKSKEQLIRSLDVQPLSQNKESTTIDLMTTDQDDSQNGGDDEDESEDEEDLEDNDDEEGQDRRIYLQGLRAKKRETRRLETKTKKSPTTSTTSTTTTTVDASTGSNTNINTPYSAIATKKRSLKGHHGKDRPPTPTTPVPTTQIIPLTPTDLVLIRQKLFAAGNFEASMRMLDTIFHAAMAKMVEGRERGVQTEPVSHSDQEDDDGKDTVVAPTVTSRSTTATGTSTEPESPRKQLQWVAVPTASAAPA